MEYPFGQIGPVGCVLSWDLSHPQISDEEESWRVILGAV